ncbi:MAG: exopolysaccharide Pel transporter PelG [Spirochaetales bacterium]|nr:exopolysaccharide Pel transporter PelG [Spirochaetales bacterium]
MAGIGFTLKRVISRGDLTSFTAGSLSGVLVVAGPSLLSMATIWLVMGPLGAARPEAAAPFTALLIYTLALSTILSGGIQYSFTRFVADRIHERAEPVAVGALLRLLAWLAPSACAAGALFSLIGRVLPGNQALAAAVSGLLSGAVTCMWVLVLFSSLLHKHARILLVYGLGMAAAAGLSWLGRDMGPAGLALGFGLGYLVLCAGLLILILAEFKPQAPPRGSAVVAMARRYPALCAYGFTYYAATWADKFAAWLVLGDAPLGTRLLLHQPTDSVAYLAGLTIVPGLAFFVIASETSYFAALRRFLKALSGRPYLDIQRTLADLAARGREALAALALFQALVTAAALLAAPALALEPGRMRGFAVYTLGAFFQLMAVAAQNFLFYVEAYGKALSGAAVFLVVNAALSTALALAAPGLGPGWGFLAGALASAVLSLFLALRSLRCLDRLLYTSSN